MSLIKEEYWRLQRTYNQNDCKLLVHVYKKELYIATCSLIYVRSLSEEEYGNINSERDLITSFHCDKHLSSWRFENKNKYYLVHEKMDLKQIKGGFKPYTHEFNGIKEILESIKQIRGDVNQWVYYEDASKGKCFVPPIAVDVATLPNTPLQVLPMRPNPSGLIFQGYSIPQHHNFTLYYGGLGLKEDCGFFNQYKKVNDDAKK